MDKDTEQSLSEEEFSELISFSNEDNYIEKTLNVLKSKYGFFSIKSTYTFVFNDGFYGIGAELINKVK